MQLGLQQPAHFQQPCTCGVCTQFFQYDALCNVLADMADPLPPNVRLRTTLRLGGLMGFIGGFLFAYQNSSCKHPLGIHRDLISSDQVRFWGWSENKREEDLDLAELRQRVTEGKPLHPKSSQPEWIQDVAYRNSAWSQLKFRECPHCHTSSLR